MVNLPVKKRSVWCAWICVLCVVFVLFGNVVQARAAETGRLYGTEAIAERGEEVTVSFAISQNPGIWGLRCAISYNNAFLKLKSASAGTVFPEGGIIMPEDLARNPFIFLAAGSTISNNTGNGVILSLTFVVEENAPLGDYAISIGINQAINVQEQDVSISTAGGKITVVACAHRNTYLKNKQDATETTEGYTGDTHCRKCDVLIKKGNTTPVIVVPCEHEKASWKIEEEATCLTNGYQKRICDDCGECLEEAVIEKTGHEKTVIMGQKAPTTTEEGYTGDTHCEKCNALLGEGTVIPKIEIVVYNMTVESGDTYYRDTQNGLVFISEADIDSFVRVEINSNILEETYYTLESGSTKVTLKPEFLETLSDGKYTLTIVSDAGTASAQFLVAQSAAQPTPQQSPWMLIVVIAAVVVAVGAVAFAVISHVRRKSEGRV